MDNVLPFTPRPREPKLQPSEPAIATLKEWLAMAERGEIVAVAIAAECADGGTNTVATESEKGFHVLLSGLVILQHRMLENRGTP